MRWAGLPRHTDMFVRDCPFVPLHASNPKSKCGALPKARSCVKRDVLALFTVAGWILSDRDFCVKLALLPQHQIRYHSIACARHSRLLMTASERDHPLEHRALNKERICRSSRQ